MWTRGLRFFSCISFLFLTRLLREYLCPLPSTRNRWINRGRKGRRGFIRLFVKCSETNTMMRSIIFANCNVWKYVLRRWKIIFFVSSLETFPDECPPIYFAAGHHLHTNRTKLKRFCEVKITITLLYTRSYINSRNKRIHIPPPLPVFDVNERVRFFFIFHNRFAFINATADNENKHDHSLRRPHQKCIACEKLDRKFFDLRARNTSRPP